MRRPQQMSTHSEEVLRHAVDRREAFHVRGRLEAAHLALALSNRLVRDFDQSYETPWKMAPNFLPSFS